MSGLTVGRMVHYVAYGTPGGEYAAGAHRAAVIVELADDTNPSIEGTVTLLVFNPTGIHFHADTPFNDTTKTPGTWHWIEAA